MSGTPVGVTKPVSDVRSLCGCFAYPTSVLEMLQMHNSTKSPNSLAHKSTKSSNSLASIQHDLLNPPTSAKNYARQHLATIPLVHPRTQIRHTLLLACRFSYEGPLVTVGAKADACHLKTPQLDLQAPSKRSPKPEGRTHELRPSLPCATGARADSPQKHPNPFPGYPLKGWAAFPDFISRAETTISK